MDLTEEEEKELLRENVSGNDELQIVDPAEEALVRKLGLLKKRLVRFLFHK